MVLRVCYIKRRTADHHLIVKTNMHSHVFVSTAHSVKWNQRHEVPGISKPAATQFAYSFEVLKGMYKSVFK